MALSITSKSDNGLEIKNSYFHIDEYVCDKNEHIYATLRAYVSRELMKSGANYISGTEKIVNFQGDYKEGSPNTKKQIYDYIKTLNEFKNAVDVLE